MNSYSRASPSPRYLELLSLYHEMHEFGAQDQGLLAADTFDGKSLGPHVDTLKTIIKVLGSKTLLDYGAGKGVLYKAQNITSRDGMKFDGICDLWGVDSVTLYDPAYSLHSILPKEIFDGVICTDVMEHCPEEDIPWIVDEIFHFAREFVYLKVACCPAKKTLPNGENAHCTIHPPDWWISIFDNQIYERPGFRYYASFDILRPNALGESIVTSVTHWQKS